MSAPASRRRRLLESIYRTYGEPAAWTASTGEIFEGVSVRRRAQEDDTVDYGANSRTSVEIVVLFVRVSEIRAVSKGDRIEILGEDGAPEAAYVVIDRPTKVRFGAEWRVTVEASPLG